MAKATPSSSSSSSWPWDNLGAYKYLLYAPLLLLWRPYWWQMENMSSSSSSSEAQWCLHVLVLSALRYMVHNFWFTFSSMLFLTRSKRISKEGVDFEQIDREWNWDNLIMFHALLGSMACYILPSATHHVNLNLMLPLPTWNHSGLLCALLLHMAVAEPLYYWVHRRCHSSGPLYAGYHSTHHSSAVLQPFTAAHAAPLEHAFLGLVMSVPLVGATLLGRGSVALVYAYVLAFDFLRCMMHSNVEIVPHALLQACPPLKYLIPTPTYHTLHHRDKSSNFCLFMPLFDAVGGTVNPKSWELHRKIRSVGNEDVPGFVFLAHVVDVVSSMHAPFVFRGYSSLPYSTLLLLLPLWPLALGVMFVMWASSKTFLVSFYNLRGSLHQTWAVPRFGFQYFLPFAQDGINEQIELAILRADRIGVKVLSLAALNKNEALNGGGTLFVKKHPNLRVRVVHGNTLTAAVILNEIPEDVGEVFLTGATSKLGRAIALYLCRKKTRVLMRTLATERFQKIQKEAPPEFQQYLVQVTKYQAAQNCKTWIVGKWLSPSEQHWAPPGTHFHQFVVPPMFGFRRDCTYGNLAAMRLPSDVQGLGSCEYTLERGVVHACHAGGVVHFLEGWGHHEVGAIDVDRIDTVWEAALRHGLRPVRGSTGHIGAADGARHGKR